MDKVTMHSGTTFTRKVTIYKDPTMSAPEDLSDANALTFKVYDAPGGNEIITGGVSPTGTQNEITIALAPEQTENMEFSVLYGLVQYEDSQAGVWDVYEFKLVIE